ncbi:LacI family DNA-binding transcriptional regulator [Promicromonospora soli]|uniref:LacI family transcriptional regulator n=1 Tax=Promicromonospora soli TaxID=2035533 RepID=A0A919L0B2_9MICO|nr:LacI family DNA-binding transcriptional regulator [Promicromonospora soli]GHH80125.1 LacI family transcriptional regulator [Promicromonospora soli]
MAEDLWSQRRTTLADVAKAAGVSRALVSIVMRDAPGASAASRERILAVAKELDYRPDVRARSLASLKAHVIGVLFGRAGRFHFELIDGLYSAAEERGWNLALSALTNSRDEKQALESLQDFRLDALVMLGPPVPDPLLAGHVPTVVVGWHVDHPDVDIVRTSDEHGLTLAVDHLVSLGHRRIAHLEGGSGLVSQSRRRAYSSAMRARGLADQIRVVPCGGEDQLDGQRAARALLQEDAESPTAIVAFNDDIAAAAMSVLAQEGIDVPGDVSVIGFDDSELAMLPGVDLTSVQQVPRELARLAVERAVARSDGAEVADREIVLEPELTVRRSTGPVRER